MEKKNIYKIVLAGDGGVGKSTLLATKTSGKFTYSSKITIGIDFNCFLVENSEKSLSFLVYDLGGQKRFHFLHDAYLKGTKGAIILYDSTRQKTFENVPHWINLMLNENANMPIILVGAKIDLVQPEDIQSFHIKWEKLKLVIPGFENIVAHTFISSKDLIGLDELFATLLDQFEVTQTCYV
ncbi:MAG: Rab family GTPase [Promethearchaeota archaeon]